MMIRTAQASDAFALSALLTELGYADTAGFISGRLEALIAHQDEVLLIAEAGHTVLGFLSLHFIPQLALAGDFARISYFCVADGERSKGLGQQLLEEAERRAGERGCDRLEVHCHVARTKANQFYQREGYEDAPVYRTKRLATA
ncbi:GNAT family N-acetyltransferase [Pantoea sp. 1.19]|uniref:GNAT family N-acetyltransferase n=1 Tax=Pantoea sp. 1.19 TaxID=1925589 RepID=UPI000948D97C|nr:GNAT family N-acetyltransferase [Pantoea sp. 1.19]